MTAIAEFRPDRRCLLLLALLAVSCAEREPLSVLPAPGLSVGLEVSSARAVTGSRVAVAVSLAGDAPAMAGVQGELRYDPARTRYAGQRVEGGTLVMVNDADSAAGVLRLLGLALRPEGLPPRVVILEFDVLDPGYFDGLGFDFEAGATREVAEIRRATTSRARIAPDLSTGSARRMALDDWYALLRQTYAIDRMPALVPGQYVLNLRYGDATLNGAVDILDAANVANLAVGNRQLLTEANRDYVIAANVHPANLPLLGEDGDSLPPGRSADGSFSIDVLDAAIVANEAVGNDQPVAGELIPGRGPKPGAGARVVLSGVLPADRTLSRDTVYELQGLVIVPGSVTLTIEAGTSIEGDVATRGILAVYRGGDIVARGTRLQPIVFTCNAVVKSRGCWGGLVINGFSLLNNGEILPGGVDVNGCPQKLYPTSPAYGGGCLIDDSSGILRYVRIEYAGMAPAGEGPVPGLSLLGVGRGTTLDSIQVHASLGAGLLVAGGTADLRGIVLTDNAGDGLRWEDGWVGRAQFVMIQQSADNDHAMHGINWSVSPDAGPRSNPRIFNVTISGPPAGLGATGHGLLFEHGSAGTVSNAIVLRAGAAGLDIQGAASCAQAAGAMPGLFVSAAIFFASPDDFATDSDCVDESAYAATPSLGNRVGDPSLIAAFNTLTPDLRPLTGSAPATGFATPPSDGFFDGTAQYVGAAPPANLSGTNIPWYAGWTRGW